MSDLTVPQVILQSALCHPEWTSEDHLAYIESETDLDTDLVYVRRCLVALRDAGRIGPDLR